MQDSGIPIAEAATRLGLTPETVRKRLQRGRLDGYKRAGAWLVVLPDSGQDTEQDRAGQRQDSSRTAAPDDLVAALRTEVDYLRAELSRAHERLDEQQRRHDTIVATLVARLPELPAAASPPAPPPAPVETHTADQAPAAARPWWRRFLRPLLRD